MDGVNIVGQTSLFKELEQRIRDVRAHPDGSIYILTDSENGNVLRIILSEDI
jgi:glucose/arabinose dehydrogenase